MKNKAIIFLAIISVILIGCGSLTYLSLHNTSNKNNTSKTNDYLEKHGGEFVSKIRAFNSVVFGEYDTLELSDGNKTAITLVYMMENNDKDLSLDNVKQYSSKLFKSIKVIEDDILSKDFENSVYTYNNDKYEYNNISFYITNLHLTKIKFIQKTDAHIKIEVSPYYIEILEGDNIKQNIVYKDPTAKEKIYEFTEEMSDNELLEHIKGKLDTYVYHFEKYNGEYILKSVTKKVD